MEMKESLQSDMAGRDGFLGDRGNHREGPGGVIPAPPRDVASLLEGIQLTEPEAEAVPPRPEPTATPEPRTEPEPGHYRQCVNAEPSRPRVERDCQAAAVADIPAAVLEPQARHGKIGKPERPKPTSQARYERHIKDEELFVVHNVLREAGLVMAYSQVMRFAGLAETAIVEAAANNREDVNERNYDMLKRWRQNWSRLATYAKLIAALEMASYRATAAALRAKCDQLIREEHEGEMGEERSGKV